MYSTPPPPPNQPAIINIIFDYFLSRLPTRPFCVIEPHPCARINSLMGLNQSLLHCHSGTLALGESIIRSPARATQTVNAQVCCVYMYTILIQRRIRERPFVSKASIWKKKVWVHVGKVGR